jgi:hypothetical protein
MERMDETEDDVDFRPRSPELRRYVEERGVSGEGDSESLLLELDGPAPDGPADDCLGVG